MINFLFSISSYEKVFKGLVNLGLSFLGMIAFALKSKSFNNYFILNTFLII